MYFEIWLKAQYMRYFDQTFSNMKWVCSSYNLVSLSLFLQVYHLNNIVRCVKYKFLSPCLSDYHLPDVIFKVYRTHFWKTIFIILNNHQVFLFYFYYLYLAICHQSNYNYGIKYIDIAQNLRQFGWLMLNCNIFSWLCLICYVPYKLTTLLTLSQICQMTLYFYLFAILEQKLCFKIVKEETYTNYYDY